MPIVTRPSSDQCAWFFTVNKPFEPTDDRRRLRNDGKALAEDGGDRSDDGDDLEHWTTSKAIRDILSFQ
jgi:hypothetical protein